MKGVHKSQKLFGRFLHPHSFFLLLFKIFVHNWTFKGLLAPFLPWHTQRDNLKIHVSIDSEKWKSMCSFNSTIGSWILSFPFYFWGATRVLTGEPLLTSSIPFLCLTREGVLSWAFALSSLPHPSLSSFFWIFMEQVVLPFPPTPLNYGHLHHEDPHQPWSRCNYQLFHSGVLLLFDLVLIFGLGFHHSVCVW